MCFVPSVDVFVSAYPALKSIEISIDISIKLIKRFVNRGQNGMERTDTREHLAS